MPNPYRVNGRYATRAQYEAYMRKKQQKKMVLGGATSMLTVADLGSAVDTLFDWVQELQDGQFTLMEGYKKLTDTVLGMVEEATGDLIISLISLIPEAGPFLANLLRGTIHGGIRYLHDSYVS